MFAKLIPISFFLLLICFWNRNDLSAERLILPEAEKAPVQTELEQKPFQVQIKDQRYHVVPRFDYELTGLVVSYEHHDGEFGLHKRWGDHFNVADFCIVWQENATTAQLEKLDFWNGEFTCNVQTRDDAAWASFDMNKLSNNHLLTSDEKIRDQLESLRIGDQVRIRGWLVDYGHSPDQLRKTSIRRDDTGNGACETILVKQVKLLKSSPNAWRKALPFITGLFLLSLFFYFKAPHRARDI